MYLWMVAEQVDIKWRLAVLPDFFLKQRCGTLKLGQDFDFMRHDKSSSFSLFSSWKSFVSHAFFFQVAERMLSLLVGQ